MSRARLAVLARPKALAFLSAVPNKRNGTYLRPEQFSVVTRYLLDAGLQWSGKDFGSLSNLLCCRAAGSNSEKGCWKALGAKGDDFPDVGRAKAIDDGQPGCIRYQDPSPFPDFSPLLIWAFSRIVAGPAEEAAAFSSDLLGEADFLWRASLTGTRSKV